MADDLTYGSYLRIPELLSLQQCRSTDAATGEAEHDETLFIIIHQVYELWFKQVLHELDDLMNSLDAGDVGPAIQRLKRVLKIFKTLVAQLDVLETMTPLEFASFRSFLANSSGFQSAQFRELEFLLGSKDEEHVRRFEQGEPAEGGRLRERFEAPSIWDGFVHLLSKVGYAIPTEVLERDRTQPPIPSVEVQEVLLDVYRQQSSTASLAEALIDLDEGLQEWRYRHVMMVQRTIGSKMGTGGSDGAAYLRSTLFRPAFPDLWAVRSQF